jgi:hypothetical protein
MENAMNNLLAAIKSDYRKWHGDNLDEIKTRMIAEFEDGLSYKVGPKYIKIISANRNQEMVWGFVMKADDAKFQAGDILKPAGWSAPARNKARGNIFGDYKIQWTGPNYLV